MSYPILFHYTTQQETSEKIGLHRELWRCAMGNHCVLSTPKSVAINLHVRDIAIELCEIFYCACVNPRLTAKTGPAMARPAGVGAK